ncbi:NAD(P)-dependent dehydrogenase (short-subunit alcohol dehydrogenase family) [Saccharopolyspora phatthalungensis]|uniref:NAD(P)-dependent dehydrogenase (Short-subunit alcohol dehydrogenase family) n=1 Tax=Saccharopolyspora phatthalungensis TaxID=664693 RepID=A0A840QD24_9PSEU|nr:NAD(P)-dependent dehydrogenase (short-subunit alcohol dehydrogenase family) [Saccharopolyspora phatthalungensis]
MNRTGIGGNVAIVTGAGQGTGAAVTTALAELGAAPRCAPDVNPERLS